MLVLAFDTSTPAVTVALGQVEPSGLTEGGSSQPVPDTVNVIAERVEIASNRHGELLAPLIREVLAAGGAAPGDLDSVAVGLGPGPFTGLRVGVVTAKAMADALAISAYGACSLTLVSGTGGGVATNARRKQVYWGVVRGADLVAGPDIATPQQAAEEFARLEVTSVAGEGPVLYPDAFEAFTVLADLVYPSAGKLLARVSRRVCDRAPSEELVPMYLRRPDAQPPGAPKRVTPA